MPFLTISPRGSHHAILAVLSILGIALILALLLPKLAEPSTQPPFAETERAEAPVTLETCREFLLQSMPEIDKGIFTLDKIGAHVNLVLKARDTHSWTQSVPSPIFLNDVLPYAVLDEDRNETIHNRLHSLCSPWISKASSLTEAAQIIAEKLPETTGVNYNTQRRAPNQSPTETLDSQKASCSGLSLLLVYALRSVAIPARVAGVLTWGHILGNHTWVEFWDGKSWQMIEYGSRELNTPWVVDHCAHLDPKNPKQQVYASSWTSSPTNQPKAIPSPTSSDLSLSASPLRFPLIWQLDWKTHGEIPDSFTSNSLAIPAINRTDYYLDLALAARAQNPELRDSQSLYIGTYAPASRKKIPATVTLLERDTQKAITHIHTLDDTTDIRNHAKLELPRSTPCLLEIKTDTHTQVVPITPTTHPTQTLLISLDPELSSPILEP